MIVRLGDPAASAGVAVGDVVLAVDGTPVSERLAMLGRYVSASRLRPRARYRQRVLRGADGSSATLTIQSANGADRSVTLPRKAIYLANVWQVDGTEPFGCCRADSDTSTWAADATSG